MEKALGTSLAVDNPDDRGIGMLVPQAMPAALDDVGLVYTYAEAPVGAWNNPASWIVGAGTPATTPPGMNDSVQISGTEYNPNNAPFELTGSGEAGSVTVSHGVIFDGSFATGALTVDAGTTTVPVSMFEDQAFAATTASILGQLSVIGASSRMTVGGTLTVGSATPGAAGVQSATLATLAGGSVLAGEIVLDQGRIGVDQGGSIEIGSGVPDVDPATGMVRQGDVTVDPGARLVVNGGEIDVPIWNDGVIELGGGNPELAEVSGNGVLQVDAGFSAASVGSIDDTQTIRFAGSNAILNFGLEPGSTTFNVTGFQATDGLQFGGDYSLQSQDSNAERTILTLADDAGDRATFTLAGNFGGQNFAVQDPVVVYQGLDILYTEITVSEAVACFCPGTLIATEAGERPVEALEIGDRVLTAAGVLRPVLWIGRRTYAQRFVAGNTAITPIRIRAGALGEGLPHRDLLVSPMHSMLLDGVLVPAALLVNGVSIVQEQPIDDVRYLHIELEDHDLLLAEGAPTESFVDDDSRSMFHNAAEYARLYPDRVATAPLWCAPRVESGHALEAILRRLAVHAGLTEPVEAPTLRTQIDDVQDGRVRGWAWCAEHPDMPVCLDILVDGDLAGQVLADRYRRDLALAGIGAGCHGFELAVPGLAARSTVTLRRSLDGMMPERRLAG